MRANWSSSCHGVKEGALALSLCLRHIHKQYPRKATMTWASTRLGAKCRIGRMARSLLNARMTASTSVSSEAPSIVANELGEQDEKGQSQTGEAAERVSKEETPPLSL